METKEYKALLKTKTKAVQTRQSNQLESTVDNSSDFWREIRKCRRPKTEHCNISTESWSSHFSRLLNSEMKTEHSVDPQADDGYAIQDESLDSEITEDEVRQIIRKLKSEKAAGADHYRVS